MKKVLALIMALLLIVPAFSAFAADSVDVYVTISDGTGALALAQEKITVTDTDEDGILTIRDALYLAHEAKFEGGAAAGFASSETQYGISLDLLWGIDNGGSYSYYVNNASPMSLSDPVSSGDYINAYAFTDLTAWSDVYTFFESNTVSAKAGAEIALTLFALEYDANWNLLTVPVENAVISVNGAATAVKTDAEGKAVITIDGTGVYTISAASEEKILVPPVCTATISAADASVTAPDTGNDSNAALYAVIFTAALVGIAAMIAKHRKSYEK